MGLAGRNLSLTPKIPADGKFTEVRLIDTAVQPNAAEFHGFLLDQLSVAGASQLPTDSPTHGTAMAETILSGLANVLGKDASSSVRILPVDVYGENTTTSTFDVALGISKAIEHGAKIINLSLGSEGDSTVLRDLIKSSHDQGIIFFAAAGNQPVTTPTYPAADPGVTAVSAVDKTGAYASYANRGEFVQAAGPGTVIIAFNGQAYAVSGTSPSTAFTSGVAAALAQSGKSLTFVEQAIRKLLPPPKN